MRDRSEEGFTLIELSVAMLLTAILLTIVAVIMNTLVHVETGTSSSYKEMNQLIPVGTSFQRLLRTAVSPATGGAGNAPVPPFGIYTKTTHSLTPATPISSTTLTFFSNTGTKNGPVKVTATLADRTFTVRTTAPTAGTCPGIGTRPFTDRCTWPITTTPRTLFSVSDVDNATLGKPVFRYHLVAPMNGPVGTGSYGTPATLGSHPFTKCTRPTYETTPTTRLLQKTITHCPAANVESVKVDLEVSVGRSAKVESQTVTYQLSTVSQTYSPEVG